MHRRQLLFSALLALGGGVACAGFDTVEPDAADAGAEDTLDIAGVDGDADADAAQHGWTLVYEDPEAADDESLNAMWVADPNNVFAVGDNRQIIHYDGTNWNALVKTKGAHLYGVWGKSADDVVAVGLYSSDAKPAIFQYDGELWTAAGPFPEHLTPLTAVWGTATMHYFTGLDAHIFQDDPVNYPTQRYHIAAVAGGCPDINDPPPILWAIDGSSVNNILAAGDSGLIAHRDSTGWTRLCNLDPEVAYRTVFRIPGSTEFFVGGNHLSLMHFVSRSEPSLMIHQDRAIADSKQAFIWSIWGTSFATILAVGDHGTILFYDGGSTGVRAVPSPTKDALFAVSGYDEQTIYICGQRNRIWRGSMPR